MNDQEITVKLQLSNSVKSTCSSDINAVAIQQSSRDSALFNYSDVFIVSVSV